jgi:hypothetical protein
VNDESACGTGVSCNLDNRRRSIFACYSHRLEMRRDVVAKRALRAPALPRQHFLKRDTVFFDVLVYSGCSAFRFPSARSDQVTSPTRLVISLTQEGNMAKKAKKAKKAKSAVKKTAKKTKKVSKKKK